MLGKLQLQNHASAVVLGVDSLVTNKKPVFAVASLLGGGGLVSIPPLLRHLFPGHLQEDLASPPHLPITFV